MSELDAAAVRLIVSEVIAEQKRQAASQPSDVDEVVAKTVSTILTTFGIEEEDRAEVRADFVHLRKWRKSVEQAQSYTFTAVITVIVTGVIGAFWLGFKTVLGK